jgi:hypothetical protein
MPSGLAADDRVLELLPIDKPLLTGISKCGTYSLRTEHVCEGKSMNLLEKSDIPTTHIRQKSSLAIWGQARGILRVAAMIVEGGTVLCAPRGPGVLANSRPQAASKEDSAIDPDAMAALDKMGDRRGLLCVSCRDP